MPWYITALMDKSQKNNKKNKKNRKFLRMIGIIIGSLVTLILLGIIVFNIVWANIDSGKRQDFITNNMINKNAKIHDMALLIQSADGKDLLVKEKGALNQDSEFAVASIAKLYTHALIFQLIDDNKLTYETKLGDVLKDADLTGLHEKNGNDKSKELTIRQLIDQTTGLADYETDKLPNGRVLMDEIIKSDAEVNFDEALRLSKELTPLSTPGEEAHYSNINAMLLGKIAETIYRQPLAEIYQEKIFTPLGLTKTRAGKLEDSYAPIYYNDQKLERPKYLASGLAAGGVISTNRELMIFTRAFFQGRLFNKKHIEQPVFKDIQFPMVQYGSGIMKIGAPRVLSPLFPAPDIIGHSGSTGSFAYYCPSKDIYVTGTVNQINERPCQYIYMYLSTI